MKNPILISITVSVITMALMSIMFWPLAIEGFWTSPVQVWGSAVSFYLFKDGKVLHYVEGDECMAWFADYKKVGAGRYRITYRSSEKKDDIVASRLFNSKISINEIESSRIRDCSRCLEVINNPLLKYLTPVFENDIVIDSCSSNLLYFYNGVKLSEKTFIERFITNLKWKEILKTPLQIYSSADDIETAVKEAIESAGFEYNIHINQEWVIDHSSPYLKVSIPNGSDLQYSIKFKRDSQLDSESLSLNEIESALRKEASEKYSWVDRLPEELDIITSSSCDISQVLKIMERNNQSYNVITNDLWIEHTDLLSWSLLYCENTFDKFYNLNGKGYWPKETEQVMGNFRKYKKGLDYPLVIYSVDNYLPLRLAQILASNNVSYEIRSKDVVCWKDE